MDENVVNAINPNNNDANNSTNKFNLIIGIATLLIALLGATFAYFSATARSAENDVTVKSAYVSISYDGGTEIKASNLIPATETVALNKYMKEIKDEDICYPNTDCELITDYDQYNTTSMLDRKCVDAKGKEVCYVYQFSIQSDGVDNGETEILASLKINKNDFTNLSYIIYEVDLRESNGTILTDKYGFDIVDSYEPVGTFDNVDKNDDNEWKDNSRYNFATFERPFDKLNENGESEGIVYPVACLFGYSKAEGAADIAKDDTSRCLPKKITNNIRHTYQLVIWLEEIGDVQDEQGLTFEGTVAIEVGGDTGTENDSNKYPNGEITGALTTNDDDLNS